MHILIIIRRPHHSRVLHIRSSSSIRSSTRRLRILLRIHILIIHVMIRRLFILLLPINIRHRSLLLRLHLRLRIIRIIRILLHRLRLRRILFFFRRRPVLLRILFLRFRSILRIIIHHLHLHIRIRMLLLFFCSCYHPSYSSSYSPYASSSCYYY